METRVRTQLSHQPRTVYVYDDLGAEAGATYFNAQGQEIAINVVLVRVAPGMTAQRIGLKPDDIILSYGGRKVTSEGQFIDLVADFRLGDLRPLVVGRGSEVLTFEVPPGKIGIEIGLAPGEPGSLARKN